MEHCENPDFELYAYSDDEESETIFDEFTIEDWQDWYSEDLLNLWFTVVDHHEYWYLPIRKTYNEFTRFILEGEDDEEIITPEVQAIKRHPFIKNRNWRNFF
jgi:hypothetical protein